MAVAIAASPRAGLDDAAVLRLAVAEGRILVTYNVRHFEPLYADFLSQTAEVPGLIFVTYKTIPPDASRQLARALAAIARKIEAGIVTPSAIYLERA